ncbi:hypothetical protein MVI01_45150 [Myxococcus virescens]|uniref:Uncharacterized protein n=1 Tax=Myxococcus virescens TaxID=83456 RepID=A0A511HGQ3_9BACT|nr:hypothetical protein MVI01_45150 [Myxococcus virescens]
MQVRKLMRQRSMHASDDANVLGFNRKREGTGSVHGTPPSGQRGDDPRHWLRSLLDTPPVPSGHRAISLTAMLFDLPARVKHDSRRRPLTERMGNSRSGRDTQCISRDGIFARRATSAGKNV